jgi:cyclic beta-1,2-glucan synthetase
VIAADVYAVTPHIGRGGWTWYTGSAGWMYRLIIEYFLGMQQKGDKLSFAPCIPIEWESFKIHYRYLTSIYHIVVRQKNHDGQMIISNDGVVQNDQMINLEDDGQAHNIEIEL